MSALKKVTVTRPTRSSVAFQREVDVERYLTEQVKALGGLCIKFSSPGMTGVPDRVIILPGGRIAFIEVKKEGGRLSERQKLVLRQFYDLGVQAEVVWNKEDVDDILERMIDGIAKVPRAET